MLWSLIARFLFILAVGYASYQLQPLGDEPVESLDSASASGRW
jgi:hypothetical protein